MKLHIFLLPVAFFMSCGVNQNPAEEEVVKKVLEDLKNFSIKIALNTLDYSIEILNVAAIQTKVTTTTDFKALSSCKIDKYTISVTADSLKFVVKPESNEELKQIKDLFTFTYTDAVTNVEASKTIASFSYKDMDTKFETPQSQVLFQSLIFKGFYIQNVANDDIVLGKDVYVHIDNGAETIVNEAFTTAYKDAKIELIKSNAKSMFGKIFSSYRFKKSFNVYVPYIVNKSGDICELL